MRVAYLDCFSGIAGDMTLGALVHAGWPADALRDVVRRLGLDEVTIDVQPVRRGGIAATHVRVLVGGAHEALDPPAPEPDHAGHAHPHPHSPDPRAATRHHATPKHHPNTPRAHRHLPEILQRIAAADLPPRARDWATRAFQRLGAAEAAVHGIPIEQVHFHEVGAADAIVDIVGACTGFDALGIQRIVCSPIPTGSGTVRCAHGVLPLPAPATAELLRGVPLVATDEPGELTTPTGAALATTLAESFGPPPPLRITAIGYGAGTRENRTRPNVLRVLVGEATESALSAANPAANECEQDLVMQLETQVDDATGQVIAYACDRLLAAGALDVFLVPIIMKKGRPGHLLTVLARPADVFALEDILLRETTTLGVRRTECPRRKLARSIETVPTAFGPIRVKIGRSGGQVLRVSPEYEDCAAAAMQHGAALPVVQEAARQAWMLKHGPERSAGH